MNEDEKELYGNIHKAILDISPLEKYSTYPVGGLFLVSSHIFRPGDRHAHDDSRYGSRYYFDYIILQHDVSDYITSVLTQFHEPSLKSDFDGKELLASIVLRRLSFEKFEVGYIGEKLAKSKNIPFRLNWHGLGSRCIWENPLITPKGFGTFQDDFYCTKKNNKL